MTGISSSERLTIAADARLLGALARLVAGAAVAAAAARAAGRGGGGGRSAA